MILKNAIFEPSHTMKEIVTAIYQNGVFKDNKILKPHFLWTNGKKYYAVCEAFGTIFTINIPRNIGDDIWDKFKTHYEGNYFYQPF
jgi:hypothetical protein